MLFVPTSILLLAFLVAESPATQTPAREPHGLTAVAGIHVGHHTLEARPTGCTVVVAPNGAVAGVDVRGGAPGTRETALLDPVNLVQTVDAIVLSGGSAFGLDAATGAVRWLEEHGHGYDTGVARVPIVPAAILFDLAVGDPTIRPRAQCGYKAAAAASSSPVEEGNLGAGAGATVGKLAGPGRAMKSGLGSEDLRFDDGLVVAALAAVNAVGTVIDPADGSPVAGVRSEDGSRVLRPSELLFQQLGDPLRDLSPVESTTLVVVATNARLTKSQATKIAQMAHNGLARAIVPIHTPFDGDTIFVLGTGEWTDPESGAVDVLRLGWLASEATVQAVLRAVRSARGLPDLPSASDLQSSQAIP
ncbi:MAG: P1 family peptidase [Thermoanaerobaculia bacterium]|nr:P1 family peptidase [Thermoanaerobaculia bacterium]